MVVLAALISMLVGLGIGWIVCTEGIKALKTEHTVVRGYTIKGRWAQFVGILYLITGVPLLVLCVAGIFYVIASRFFGVKL